MWLGVPVSSICFPYHIPVTHLIDSLTKSLTLVMVWETGGGGLVSILLLGPSLSWEKGVPLLVCVSSPHP